MKVRGRFIRSVIPHFDADDESAVGAVTVGRDSRLEPRRHRRIARKQSRQLLFVSA